MFIIYLFFNFAIVMIANRMSPGIEIADYENVVNIGADLLLSFIIGFFNTLIVPTCVSFNVLPTTRKIVVTSAIISFGAYILLAFINFGVKVNAFYGVIFAGLIVTCGSVIVGLFYKRKFIR